MDPTDPPPPSEKDLTEARALLARDQEPVHTIPTLNEEDPTENRNPTIPSLIPLLEKPEGPDPIPFPVQFGAKVRTDRERLLFLAEYAGLFGISLETGIYTLSFQGGCIRDRDPIEAIDKAMDHVLAPKPRRV